MFVKRMFTAAAAAAACLFLLSSAACAPAYVPAKGEIYFRDGDVYRVISQSGEGNAVEGKVVDVVSPFVLVDPVQSFGVVFTYTYGFGSLFAEKAGIANEEGAAAVYDALGMAGRTLAEEPYLAAEPLYAWSGRVPQDDHWVNLPDPSAYTGAVALGYQGRRHRVHLFLRRPLRPQRRSYGQRLLHRVHSRRRLHLRHRRLNHTPKKAAGTNRSRRFRRFL